MSTKQISKHFASQVDGKEKVAALVLWLALKEIFFDNDANVIINLRARRGNSCRQDAEPQTSGCRLQYYPYICDMAHRPRVYFGFSRVPQKVYKIFIRQINKFYRLVRWGGGLWGLRGDKWH